MNSHYQPDFAVHPGEHLEEMLAFEAMTQAELAERLGLHKKTINEIIKGKASITSEIALRLDKVFHYPARLWISLQRNYDETRARLAERGRLQSHLEWLRQLPITDMVKRGWIGKHEDKIDQLDAILQFFGIASPDRWQAVCGKHQIAYRQSQRVEPDALAVSVWLRQGEIEARRMDCAPYDGKTFRSALNKLRALTLESPEIFRPELIKICAGAGVAVVFIPELPRIGVFGCARWLGGKAVIQLSLRYKSNDQLWLTFFHEAGHILKHSRKTVFLEDKRFGGEDEAKKEDEANAFARDKLIPPADYRRFLAEWDGQSLLLIEDFAKRIGIAPGIVVGRLQIEKRLDNARGNRLKVFYRWEEGQNPAENR